VSRLMPWAEDAPDSMRVPQRPQKVPPGAISVPQEGQFIFCSCITAGRQAECCFYFPFVIASSGFSPKRDFEFA